MPCMRERTMQIVLQEHQSVVYALIFFSRLYASTDIRSWHLGIVGLQAIFEQNLQVSILCFYHFSLGNIVIIL